MPCDSVCMGMAQVPLNIVLKDPWAPVAVVTFSRMEPALNCNG